MRRDLPPRDDVLAQRDDGRDLRGRIGVGRPAVLMALMRDLDADRHVVHVGLAVPDAAAGVPGPARLGHELQQRAVGHYHVMGGDLHDRIAQQLDRGLAGRHARVMQDERIRRAAPFALAVVRRGARASQSNRCRA